MENINGNARSKSAFRMNLLQLWREKRGEAEPEDLSGNLIVQLGLVTEALNRHWFERNTEQTVECVHLATIRNNRQLYVAARAPNHVTWPLDRRGMERKMKKVLMALAAVILTSGSALASTYYFSFSGSLGDITGHVDGLSPGYTGPADIMVSIDSAPVQFLSTTPATFYATDDTHNNFVVDSFGTVTSFDLFAQYQIYVRLNLSSDCLSCNHLEADTLTTPIIDSALSFPTFSAAPPAATPIPNSAVLFASIFCLGVLLVYACKRTSRLNEPDRQLA